MGLSLRSIASSILHATDGRDALINSPSGWEVEAPWLWWLGPDDGSRGPFGNPLPGAGWPTSGAASIPAVARATSLIVDTLAALPWRVMRGTEQLPTPDWIADPQALRLDGRVVDAQDLAPIDRMSAMDFWCQWIVSALWYGDGFIWTPSRATDGTPKPPLFVLHPLDVERRDDGRWWAADHQFRSDELIHLRGLSPIHDGRGSGVLQRFTAQLAYSQSLRNYAAGVFRSGVPAGYLKVTKEGLAQDKADELKAKWLAAHGGDQRSIAVLNATTEFHALTFSPVDAALVEVMAADLNSLANAFGVPVYLLGGATDSNTYANVESRRMDLATFTYLPWSARIEAVLDSQFPRGVSVKVALDALQRADIKTRTEVYATQIATGILTVDEARALEDRPPLPAEESVA